MFGRKAKLRKQQQLEAQRQAELAAERQAALELQPLEPIEDEPVADNKIFCESEELEEKDHSAQVAELVALPPQTDEPVAEVEQVNDGDQEPQTEKKAEDEAVEESSVEAPADERATIANASEQPAQQVEDAGAEQAPAEESAVAEQPVENAGEETNVVYSMDNVDEEAEAKPAKLIKLPNLMDYIVNANVSTKVKIQVAVMLVGAYNKFKDIPEEKQILKDCMKKIIRSLQQELQK